MHFDVDYILFYQMGVPKQKYIIGPLVDAEVEFHNRLQSMNSKLLAETVANWYNLRFCFSNCVFLKYDDNKILGERREIYCLRVMFDLHPKK